MRLRKQHGVPVDTEREADHETRLRAAESRANALLRTAEWIHAAVSARDKENRWQESVNRLFTGSA